MSSIRVLPKDLQNGFAGVCIVGSLEEDVEQWSKKCPHVDNPEEEDDENYLELSVAKTPIMMCQNDVRNIFVNSQYDKIELLKKRIAEDLREVHENVNTTGIAAFEKAEENYYLAQTSTGAIWIHNHKIEKRVDIDDDSGVIHTEYVNYYQVGKYSANANVAIMAEYIFKANRNIAELILAALIGQMIQTILKEGTKLVLATLIDELTTLASKNGLKTTVDVVENGASYLVQGIIFILSLVGLNEEFDWEIKRYTVKVNIYNWNSNHTLYVSDCYLDNAKMICKEEDMRYRCEIHIPPMIPPDCQLTPAGFVPATNFDVIAHFATYFFANDATFLRGLGLALKVSIGQKESNKGFMYALKCPRFRDNRHKIESDLGNYDTLQDYYDKGEWNKNPLNFEHDVEGVKLHVALDALNGNDSYYRSVINYL